MAEGRKLFLREREHKALKSFSMLEPFRKLSKSIPKEEIEPH